MELLFGPGMTVPTVVLMLTHGGVTPLVVALHQGARGGSEKDGVYEIIKMIHLKPVDIHLRKLQIKFQVINFGGSLKNVLCT